MVETKRLRELCEALSTREVSAKVDRSFFKPWIAYSLYQLERYLSVRGTIRPEKCAASVKLLGRPTIDINYAFFDQTIASIQAQLAEVHAHPVDHSMLKAILINAESKDILVTYTWAEKLQNLWYVLGNHGYKMMLLRFFYQNLQC